MVSMSHGAFCQCVDCRAERNKPTTNAPRSAASGLSLPQLRLTPDEQAAIMADPLTFIVTQREEGVPVQRTRNELALAGMSTEEADELLGRVEAVYVEATYREAQKIEPERVKRARGIRRLAQGLAFTVGGLVLTVPLALFFSAYSIFGVALLGFGIFRLVQGVRETRATQGVKS